MNGEPRFCLNCGSQCRWSRFVVEPAPLDWVCTDCGFEIENSEHGVAYRKQGVYYRRPEHYGFGFCEVPAGTLLVVNSEEP
jgi:hypothetical protein